MTFQHAGRDPQTMSMTVFPAADVLIIGAGLSGLVAGRALSRAGVSVRLLEACAYPGGRTVDHLSRFGYRFPLGATYLGPDETRLTALLQELGIKTTLQFETGKVVIHLNGSLQHHSDVPENIVRVGPLPIPRTMLTDGFLQALEVLDRLSEQVPLEHPETAPLAVEWDAMTLDEWCRQNIADPADRALFIMLTEDEVGAELDQLSFLYYLFIRRAMLNHMVDDRTLIGGTQQICSALAEQLSPHVHYATVVQAIEQTEEDVRVHTSHGCFPGRYVIVTAPPGPALAIRYHPPMPEARSALLSASSLAQIMKCFVVYPTPFWRTAGFSGLALSDEGPMHSVFDFCPTEGPHGALKGFITHRDARYWSQVPAEERQEAVIQQLVRLFGEDARHPVEYIEQDWLNFPWTRGAYFPNLPPGMLTRYGHVFRQPFQRIHWAGTETECEWTGSMEGAVRSGERVAQEVLQRVTATHSFLKRSIPSD